MLTRLLRFGLVLALPATVIACADQSSNTAPIIDSVDAPLTVSAQNGAYAIPVTLLFHDNDGEAVTRLHYRLPPNVDGMIDVPAPNPQLESAQVTIVIPVAALEPTDESVSSKHDDSKNAAASPKKDDSDTAHAPDAPNARKPRAFELSVVDGRGGESAMFSSSVTLD